MKKLILLVLILPMVALSDPQLWMKKENPNELMVLAFAEDRCPIDTKELTAIADGVFVRSRIKPTISAYENFYLLISLSCSDSSNADSATVSFIIDFVGYATPDGGPKSPVRFGSVPANATFGTASTDTIRQQIRNDIEDVVTDYLKANFDLGEDK